QSVDASNQPLIDPTNSHTLFSNTALVMNVPNGTFVDNYVAITTSAPRPDPTKSGLDLGNTLTIYGGNPVGNTVGNITLAGTPGPITVTGGNDPVTGLGPVILIQSRGIGSSVNIDSNYSFGAGSSGEIDLRVLRDVTFNASGCSCIQLADNTTLSSGG